MIQLTYANDSGTIGIDNTDLRFANNIVLLPQETSLIYGISVNNNPTVQDLWNSTPAWGFPYAAAMPWSRRWQARRSTARWRRMSQASACLRHVE
jgi:frataxin-like iron-binding protein CyaY